jgi:hypothetical protein
MTTPYVPVLTAKEVQIGTSNGPGLYVAPPGTAMPADADTAPATPWALLGYISDDGPTVGQSVTKEDITPWQSRSPIRSVVTEKTITMQFVLWQINPQTVAMYFDNDPVDPDADGSFEMDIRSDTPQPIYAVMIDSMDQRPFRIGFTRASLSDAGDMKITKGAAVPLEVTLTALDDAGVLGHVSVGGTPAALMEERGLSESDPRVNGHGTNGNGNGGNGGTAPQTTPTQTAAQKKAA